MYCWDSFKTEKKELNRTEELELDKFDVEDCFIDQVLQVQVGL